MGSPADRIAHARAVLAGAGISSEAAALDAEVLARHALSWDRAALLTHGRDPAPPGFEAAFDLLVARRLRREPVAQIVGHREFWGLEFEVTPAVLVPRPETELIVEEAMALAGERRWRTAVDVGTGSGCIAVSLARELRDVRITATDNSRAALEVARRNALRHRVADRVTFVETDLVDGIGGCYDLVVSNPPYIPDRDANRLQPEILQFEPAAALFGGADGLSVIRRLLRDAGPRVTPEGTLIFEFGIGQEEAVRGLAQDAEWRIVRIRKDLQDIPRTAVLTRLR